MYKINDNVIIKVRKIGIIHDNYNLITIDINSKAKITDCNYGADDLTYTVINECDMMTWVNDDEIILDVKKNRLEKLKKILNK